MSTAKTIPSPNGSIVIMAGDQGDEDNDHSDAVSQNDQLSAAMMVAIMRKFLGDPFVTGIDHFDGPMLNVQVTMRLATDSVFTGGLRESLIALLRSPHEIAPYIRHALADALERGASSETSLESGLHSWKLQIVGLGTGKGRQNNQGEGVRTRRKWGEVGEFLERTIHLDGKRGKRKRAIAAAKQQFNVGDEYVEKAYKYFGDREKWVVEVSRIQATEFLDEKHRQLAFEGLRLEYDALHAHNRNTPNNRLTKLRTQTETHT